MIKPPLLWIETAKALFEFQEGFCKLVRYDCYTIAVATENYYRSINQVCQLAMLKALVARSGSLVAM
jgi:hypothetical protein